MGFLPKGVIRDSWRVVGDIRIYARPALYVYELKVRVVLSKDTDTRIWTVTRTGDTLYIYHTRTPYIRTHPLRG
jgi:hypothetical protein